MAFERKEASNPQMRLLSLIKKLDVPLTLVSSSTTSHCRTQPDTENLPILKGHFVVVELR